MLENTTPWEEEEAMDDPLMGTNSLTIALPFQAMVVFTIALIVYKF